MSIRTRLYSGFAVVLAVTAIGFLTALLGLDQLRDGFARYERQVGITNRISKAESRLLTAKGVAETFVLSGAQEDLDTFATMIVEARAALSDALSRPMTARSAPNWTISVRLSMPSTKAYVTWPRLWSNAHNCGRETFCPPTVAWKRR